MMDFDTPPELKGRLLEQFGSGEPDPNSAEGVIRSMSELLEKALSSDNRSDMEIIENTLLELLTSMDHPAFHRQWAFYCGMLTGLLVIVQKRRQHEMP
jgi:hypothetical protein